ncbi:hypothetical protein J6590_104160, partial [Homalodisca vitripennis]
SWPKHRAEAPPQLRTRGLHTTVYTKGIKLAKTPRRSSLTVTDERVTYNCVHQGNKVGQNTAPEPAHSYGREGYIQPCTNRNKVGQKHRAGARPQLRTRGLHTTVYTKGIKLAQPPRRSPLTVTDERVTYNCVHQGNKVGQNTAPEPAHSYGREGYIQLCTPRE